MGSTLGLQKQSVSGSNGGLSARWAGKSSGSQCRKAQHAAYQNQQHLSLQTQKKLMTKVPDFQSQFLNSKEPQGMHKQGNMSEVNMALVPQMPGQMDDSRSTLENSKNNRFSQLLDQNRGSQPQHSGVINRVRDLSSNSSPIKQNRPRITNQVQSQGQNFEIMMR